MRRFLLAAGILTGLALLVTACDPFGDDDDDDDDGGGNGGGGGDTLAEIQDRGELICGVNDAVPGFGFVEAEGDPAGFDVDFCRAVAAAIFGDAEAVQYIPLTAQARFEALSAGEIDVLIRNTTNTVSRDADLNSTFAPTTFYDGQGMMVREGEFESIEDMDGATVCVLQGTTTEQNLADRFDSAGLSYTPLTFEDNETLQAAFFEERCDGWTSDKSQLAGVRSAFPDDVGGPDCCVIFEETFSKEPLGPATRDGETQWTEVVTWVVNGMIIAEEFGVTSENVDDFINDPQNPEVARLLGVALEGEEVFDPGLGLDPTFMQEVIRQVGNYGEVYERNLGPLELTREGTLNALYADGGILYAPPWR